MAGAVFSAQCSVFGSENVIRLRSELRRDKCVRRSMISQ